MIHEWINTPDTVSTCFHELRYIWWPKWTHIKQWSTKAVRDPWCMIQKPAVTEICIFTPGSRPSYYMFSPLINHDISLDAMRIGILISQIPSTCNILLTVWLHICIEGYIMHLIDFIWFSPKFLMDIRSDIAILILQTMTFCSRKVSVSRLVFTVNYCLLFRLPS